MGKLRDSEFLEVPIDCLHFHLRRWKEELPSVPTPPNLEVGRATLVQEEPRGILSGLLGVARSSAGSTVIYLSVCVCVCE